MELYTSPPVCTLEIRSFVTLQPPRRHRPPSRQKLAFPRPLLLIIQLASNRRLLLTPSIVQHRNLRQPFRQRSVSVERVRTRTHPTHQTVSCAQRALIRLAGGPSVSSALLALTTRRLVEHRYRRAYHALLEHMGLGSACQHAHSVPLAHSTRCTVQFPVYRVAVAPMRMK
jgi:hypothetical protein